MNLATVEVKAYVPARDFELSKQFYVDLGFTLSWSSTELADLRAGSCAFLLQNYYVEPLADNFMMHLRVEDADAWWMWIEHAQLAEKYGVRALPPEDRDWGLRDLVLFDPSGVLWRIGHVL